MKDLLVMLAIWLFYGCILGSGIATIMSFFGPLERMLWFRRASFYLIRAATVVGVVLTGLVLLG
ncbi:hypothetical protein [Herpetosiphon geysericola]|uniref:Uncharacterized protein n=1 Tax=Herpetosiphon geysericola TaxID=70996 RepID=A0A0P6Y222_9CHLR|nr:hypothetical protein [Herpetosiphon geysericola]KPL83051.1 hypothetical protein SE18_19615 [Herpetosiphon geysericola]